MHTRFENTLTTRDCKRHISHRVTLPEQCERLTVDFCFAPERVHDTRNMLTLTVFDPHGFRGAGHRGGNVHHVSITSSQATPGYLPGPLPAGEWIVQIDTHMIMPGEPLHYSLDVGFETFEDVSSGTPSVALEVSRGPAGLVAREGKGWYRGDLHAHSWHSDAAGFSVEDLIREARSWNLDFVFLTDHNTVSGLKEMDAAVSPDLLTAGGMELTTFWGHALCLGTREWVDWRFRPRTGAMAQVALETYARDQVFIIAHPQADGDPGCTGCSWRFGDMMPGNARAVEIWNGPWVGDSNNEFALLLFYDWLNQGLHLVATAGTDAHGSAPQDAGLRPGFNVIYADSLSERGLLDALSAGHLYLSSGPTVRFEAEDVSGRNWMVGDTVVTDATFSVVWESCPQDALIRVIADGKLLSSWTADGHGERQWTMTSSEATWLVVEVRSADGDMLAVTNPIFLGLPDTDR